MLINSLRGRLFIGLTIFTVGMALVAGYLAYRWAVEEAIELQDAILLQVGSLAANNHLSAGVASEGGIDGDAQLLIEDIKPGIASTAAGYPASSLSSDLPDGLQTVMRKGTQWRILVRTRPDGSRVAVGQPTASRDETAQDSALRTIVPLGILIPCLMVLIAIVIDRSLRPLSRLAAHLDAKQAGHFQKLSTEAIPTELRPFVTAINDLLERLTAMFNKQRRFVADAAHELRTPITALIVQAENLEQAGLSEDGRNRLNSLRTGIRRTGHMLEQLLALARYDDDATVNAPQTAFDLILKQVVADLLPVARNKSIDLGFSRIESIPVRLEPIALTTLAQNLLGNALRHTPPGGRVDVSLSVENEFAILRIEDTGTGIPDADLGRIFEPFFRGSRSRGEGSGLGLSIVQRIVKRCHGSIRLENKSAAEGPGLRAIVSIPRG